MTLPSLSLITWAFVGGWFILLNSAWLLPSRWLLLAHLCPHCSFLRWLEWLWRLIALFGLAMALDHITYLAPHEAYTRWETYAAFLLFSMLISSPGWLWCQYRRQNSADWV